MKYKGLTAEQRRKQYLKDRELIQLAQKTQVSFVGSDLKLRMGVTVLGGCTGRGKSTTSANVLAHFYSNYPNRQALVITNEEVSADVLDRVSCVLLDLNFYQYRDGNMSEERKEQIQSKSLELMDRIEVVCSTEVDMTCYDDVREVLQSVNRRKDIHLVVVDYLQTITWSKKYKDAGRYDISKRLGLFLKEYGRQVTVPVLIFAQLYPSNGSGDLADFATRVQGDKTFVNHAVMAVEIVPDFETQTTEFVLHKDRFGGKQGQSLKYRWLSGKLVHLKGLKI